MKRLFTTLKSFSCLCITLFVLAPTTKSYGQIYTYLNDSVGNYSAVATNATGTPLGRINSATSPLPACHDGFSSKNFPSTMAFATTLPADTLAVWPNSGYTMSVTGFSVGIRRSNTGPDSVRFAYSTNGGTTWINEGVSHSPKNAGCDTILTAVWTKTVTVTYPAHLEFAVFGYAASSISGTFQLDTMTIAGTVHAPSSVLSETMDNGTTVSIYPNPASEIATISYTLSQNEHVSISLFNILGQEVSKIANAENEAQGEHKHTITVPAAGVYFVKVIIGDAIQTRQLIKL